MNKFKKWLIRKLGGYVYLADAEKIVYKTLPCSTFHVDIMLPPTGYDFTDKERTDWINREAAERIGAYIIKNHLYDLQFNHNFEFDRETARFTIRVIPTTKPDFRVKIHRTEEEVGQKNYEKE